MKRSTFCLGVAAMLYGAIGPTANALGAVLSYADLQNLKRLAVGPLDRLVVHDKPRQGIDAGFTGMDGDRLSLAQMQGKVVLLNLWATWCPPCRAEMPTLDRLQGAMGGDDFQVVAISTDRGGIGKAADFLRIAGLKNLQVLHDPDRAVSLQVGVLGLPVTLILDRQGREIARMLGDADWSSREARVLIGKAIKMTGGQSDGPSIKA